MTQPLPSRVVLDTNAALDLLHFGDPRCAPLRAKFASGEWLAITDEPCRAEWLRVLGYPALALDADRQAALVAAFDTLASLVGILRDDVAKLPRCADRDDQKFLELAARSGAIALVTRDAELLRWSRRTQRDFGFAIVTPEQVSGVTR
jgi:predicted nucleic acid-binding protein